MPLYLTSYAVPNPPHSSTPNASATPNPKSQADALYQEGNELLEKHHWRLALEKYQQSIELYQGIGDKSAIANTLVQLGLIDNYLKPVELTKTLRLEYVTEAVKTCKRILEQFNLKDEGDGSEFFQEALRIRKEMGDRAGEAEALFKLGETYEIRRGKSFPPNIHQNPY